jgi:hypothetical protein
MKHRFWLLFFVFVLLMSVGVFVSLASALTVNVKVRCNTSTCLDTLRSNHLVRMMGSSNLGTTPAISWSDGPVFTNVGGDYWEATVAAKAGDTLKYKFVAEFSAGNATIHWSGWEGPLDAGGAFSSGNDRVLIVGTNDTTLPVQYYNGTDGKLPQYGKPFATKQDTVAVYFRVNMAGETDFNPATHVPGVYGTAPLGSGSWPKIIDLVRETSSRNGAFWSGVAYIPKANVLTTDWETYKFVYNGVWESSTNRFFPFSNNIINITGDTTINWVYFSNKAPSNTPVATVNVKIRCNTSTCLDTLQTTHIVGIGGESQKGVTGLNWSAGLKLTNVKGDYWETTVQAQPGDTIYYSFVTKYNDTTFSLVNWGWDGPINNGVNSRTNRMLVVGANDTVLPLQYYNGGTAKVAQYGTPFVAKQDTVAIYFRVNMGGVSFDPATQTVEVQGGIGSASWAKVVSLARETGSINNGSFWSGTAYVAKTALTVGAQQKYKFVFRSPETWESSSDRSFYYSDATINGTGDTTLHWNYFNNKAPSGPKVDANLLFRLKLNALENAHLFNRTLGDKIGVTGPKGWAVPPFVFDTDPTVLKMVYNSDLEEWNLIEPFSLYPNDQIVYKYYIAWDSSRVNPLSANYIPGLDMTNGWEEPGVTGGADRKYTYTSSTDQIVPGDFGADQQFFNSIHPYGAITTPISVTFRVNMVPATVLATNPTNPLFRPGTDSVFISFDGCFVPVTQGKTMYGTDNRIELTDLDGDGIYTGTMPLNAPTLYQFCYRVTYTTSVPNSNVTNGGGILMGRRYYQYVKPTRVQANGVLTWPSTYTFAIMDWKVDNLTNETPPDLETVTGVNTNVNGLPRVYALEQNYPNPFNPSTVITYAMPEKAHVKIEIFNILGQRTITLMDQEQPAGTHSLEWNAANTKISSGVYFLKMQAGAFTQVKKMVLTK